MKIRMFYAIPTSGAIDRRNLLGPVGGAKAKGILLKPGAGEFRGGGFYPGDKVCEDEARGRSGESGLTWRWT
jgi:hypothetical protein